MGEAPSLPAGQWRLLTLLNLTLVVLYPVAWLSPLATAGLVPWFEGDQITILGGVGDLWEADRALAVLVALFAVVVPYAKTLALAAVHWGLLGRRTLPVIETIGRLSMADVFLIAVYIVVVKGVGLGHVATGWGLWLFTGCVLMQIGLGVATARQLGHARG